MVVIYETKRYVMDFPDDTKFFKLTRRYYPNKLVVITRQGKYLQVKLSSLKCIGEIRSDKINRHHLTPKSRGGQAVESNLLKMDISRHNAWHLLFGNLTLKEIIILLKRLYKAKKNTKLNIRGD